jgi:putative SOS response-associated peptidase YedK
MFGRRELTPAKILRLNGEQWRQGDLLRVTPRRRWDGDPEAKRMVVRRRDVGEFALTPMRWGLVPDRQEGEQQVRPLITVRAEAIAGQVDWRRLLNARRCIVPAEQFFEWLRVGDVKAKEYAFRLKNNRPMMIAGLWNRTPEAGKIVETFAYISCEANRLVSQIHDRMPVVLDDAGVKEWFNPDASLEELLALLEPIDSSELEYHPVSNAPVRVKPYQPSLFASRAA